MSIRTAAGIRVAVVAVGTLCSAAAATAGTSSSFVRALDEMMVALGPESARAGATIRRAYQEHLDFLTLEGYPDLAGALDNGGLVPLPDDLAAFNLSPRLAGPNPIGEKDLRNQASYVAARPATIGALVEVASRVKSGPLEITSLVRHTHYQDALRATNPNANTSVPMHAMGLAFDIGVVNTPLRTVYEIRDVLRRMQRNGDILFIGERRQLVFHVVPHPSRLGHFTDVYMRKVGLPPTSRSAHVMASLPGRRARPGVEPRVTAEVLAFLPLGVTVPDAPVAQPAVHETPVAPVAGAALSAAARSADEMVQRWFVLLVALLASSWRIVVQLARTPAPLSTQL
jgi:hypothetical protein